LDYVLIFYSKFKTGINNFKELESNLGINTPAASMPMDTFMKQGLSFVVFFPNVRLTSSGSGPSPAHPKALPNLDYF
jgi:hypothetical protein